jgi:hypothetical protein
MLAAKHRMGGPKLPYERLQLECGLPDRSQQIKKLAVGGAGNRSSEHTWLLPGFDVQIKSKHGTY